MATSAFVISEFLAANNSGLKDQDNEFSDWIEIHNRTLTTQSIAGWYLTDSSSNLTKWQFPNMTVGPDAYLIVFASGKNRAVAGSELHSNFSLSSSGEYLGLVQADGVTVASAYDPSYPSQVTDVSYGVSEDVASSQYVTSGASGKLFLPTGDIGNSWNGLNYDDSAWTNATTGVGFDAVNPATTVQAYVNNANTSGTQTFTGSMGQDFTVNQPIVVTRLGVFDSGSNGIKRTLTSQLWQRSGNTGTKLAELQFSPTDQGELVNGNRFKSLASPLILQPGTYSIVAYGYGGSSGTPATYEPNGNENIGGPTAAQKSTNSGNGALTFTNTRFGSNTSVFPTSTNANPFLFSAATLEFSQSVYGSQFGTDVQSTMYNLASSAYLRLPFSVAETGSNRALTLKVKYDDAFVAYLNGVEIARSNVGGAATWNTLATSDRPSTQATTFENFDVSNFVNLLQQGNNNVLAIQGINSSLNSTDFLLNAELISTEITGSAIHYYSLTTPGTPNSSQYYSAVAAPKFDRDHGFYDSPFDVKITTDTPGATIRYTTDGSTPTSTTGTVYSSPVHITTTTTLRAGAFLSGFASPNAHTESYIFLDSVIHQPINPAGFPSSWGNGITADYQMDPDVVNNATYVNTIKNDLKAIPTMSLVTSVANLFDTATGIYANPTGEGSAWERPTSVELINPDGSAGFQIDAGLRIHGGYSRQPTATPKHAFRIAFRADYGTSKLDYPLFPDSDVTKFDTLVLRAQFNYAYAGVGFAANSTYLQDQFARDTQLAMGDLAGHGRFVHLYLDGLYWGIYNVTERSDAAMAAEHLGGDAADYDTMNTFAVADGNVDAWNTAQTLANAGLTTAAAYNEFKKYVDVVNLADYVISNVYGGNWDWPQNNWVAIRRSRVDGVPVFDSGFRFYNSDAEGTLYDINADRSTADYANSPGRFYAAARANPEFKLMFADRLQKFFFNGGVLSPSGAAALHQTRATEIDRAIVGESARWGDQSSGVPVTRNTDWAPQINWLNTQYFPQRTQVVLNQFKTLGLYPAISPPTFSQRGGLIVAGASVTLTATAGLTIYYTTDGSDPRLEGGAISPTALVYSGAIPLPTTTDIKVRTRNASATWSALDEVVFAPDTSTLRITEIMYNPTAPAVGSPFTADNYEYVELQNTGNASIDLKGVQFTNGINYTFPQVLLAPGQRIVLAANAVAFAERYPGVAVFDTFDGALSNSGDGITLTSALGTTILDFNYKDGWYPATDGDGFSLVINNAGASTSAWNDSPGWRASQFVGGNPGTADSGVAAGSVVVNEVLSNTTSPTGDRIELFNTTGAPIDIGGWYLSNSDTTATDLKKFRIPIGTILPALGYAVFSEADFNSPTPGTNVPFTLSLLGDSVFVSSADAAGNLGGYRESEKFGAAAAEVPFGRYLKSTGGKDFFAEQAATFGAANTTPAVGPVVINEVKYYPLATTDEYIELRNITGSTVQLFDPANPANTWKFTDGVTFSFPLNSSLPANAYALVVGIDPNTFRAKYAIPGSVQIFGPYTGLLDNSGEKIQLSKPGVPQPGPVVPYIEVDRLEYDTTGSWPAQPANIGTSISRRVSTNYGNDVANWGASQTTGTPGTANTLPTVPQISIGDVVLTEGNAGSKNFVFPLSLNVAPTAAVTVVYTTTGDPTGTATAGSDYTATTGTATFGIGVTSVNITVPVLGNTASEPDETFFVKLSSSSGATILDSLGQGTIQNDDNATASIASRLLVYNNSKFDGNTAAGGASDDAAIAPDKSALLPGNQATFANYSSYSRGINAIVVDIASPTHTPTLSDFVFKLGNDNYPLGWDTAPAPQSIVVRNGAGAGGSTRVEITWADGAITKTWLQTTVSASLGLAAADVFYFGNSPGEAGNAGNAIVNSTDELLARNNPRSFDNPAPIDFRYDYNRDGYVNAADQLIARNNSLSLGKSLKLISAPAAINPVALVQSATATAAGSVWRYLDNGSDQGTAWRQPNFNDASWATGPSQLGYGDGDEATTINSGPAGNVFITSYFRHTFAVADGDAKQLANLSITLTYDDGAVVYLNGTEIQRVGMPGTPGDNTILFSTPSNVNTENTVVTFAVPKGLLHDGANTLAVEVHQRDPASTDVSFDLLLSANRYVERLSSEIDGGALGMSGGASAPLLNAAAAQPVLTQTSAPAAVLASSSALPGLATTAAFADWDDAPANTGNIVPLADTSSIAGLEPDDSPISDDLLALIVKGL